MPNLVSARAPVVKLPEASKAILDKSLSCIPRPAFNFILSISLATNLATAVWIDKRGLYCVVVVVDFNM